MRTAELRSDDLYYVCGNPFAVKDIVNLLQGRGVPDKRIILEFYYAY